MNISIKCTQQEFARLVRVCARVSGNVYCSGCVLEDTCRERGDAAGIEHVVAVDLVEDGAADV